MPTIIFIAPNCSLNKRFSSSRERVPFGYKAFQVLREGVFAATIFSTLA